MGLDQLKRPGRAVTRTEGEAAGGAASQGIEKQRVDEVQQWLTEGRSLEASLVHDTSMPALPYAIVIGHMTLVREILARGKGLRVNWAGEGPLPPAVSGSRDEPDSPSFFCRFRGGWPIGPPSGLQLDLPPGERG
jgi:hypothetical protein